MQDDPQKREIVNRRHFSFRLNLFFFVTFALFSVLIVKLAILQFVEGPTLSAEGIQKNTRSVKIPPIRGNIYDSTGYPIAYYTSTQSLYFTIQPDFKLDKEGKSSKEMATRLYEVFSKHGAPAKAMTVDDIIRQMDLNFSRNNITVPRRIKSGLTNAEVAYFMENRSSFKGIDIMEESVRNYDESSIAVQLVGYLKKFNTVRENTEFYKQKTLEEDPTRRYLDDEDVGFDGLERMYQDVLRGTNGLKTYPVNNAERIIGPMQITNPTKGSNLYLTLNKNVQLKTEQAIMDQLKKISTSTNKYESAKYAQTGFAVAMEVDTGKIVSMASMPDYDANIWSGGRISKEDYDNFSNTLSNGTIRTVYGKYSEEERNEHPSSILPPGSTLKPLSVLVGLNEKLFTTTDRFHDTGKFGYGKKGYETFIGNSQGKIFGYIDAADAIENSSNPFMASMIGNRLYMRPDKGGMNGVKIWDDYMKQFGLGVLTGSGLPNETKGIIEYFNEAEAGSAQSALVQASFGQQGRYTTLQLAQYTAMLANRGKRMKPQFVNEIKDADGNLIESFKPEVLNEVKFPLEYWEEIEEGMSKVKSQGFEGVDYTYNRKTGTSEQSVARGTANNAVFIAYAPADKPKLAVAVVVPDGGFGGYGAAPIARKIFDAYNEEVGLYGVPKKKTPDTTNTNNSSANTANTANGATGTTSTNE